MSELNQDHVAWSRTVFNVMKEGATWAVPRSGLVFQRKGNGLVLVSPEKDAMSQFQRDDFKIIAIHFAAAGVAVTA